MKPLCLTIIACVALAGCGGKKRAHIPAAARIGATQTGIASWYGHPYHGRAAANGEIYDMEKMTAAHRTRPFGTWVRVHNLDSGKTVEVRASPIAVLLCTDASSIYRTRLPARSTWSGRE